MSKKIEICSATYNIALNQNTNDVFGTGCAHLYHFLQGNCNYGKSEECKPMMLKMHLELNESIEETEEQIVEPSNSNNPERPFIQQPEAKVQSLEDSLQSTDDVVNKIIKRMEQLEKNLLNIIVNKETDVGNNSTDHESNNDLISIFDNSPIQSTLQLEAKLKTLEDALQASNADAVNKLMKRLEKLENNISKNIVDKTPGVGNNTIDHDSNNVLLNLSDNSPIQSALQLEAKLKTLEDALQASNADAVNKLMERMEKLENNISKNIVDKTPGVANNTIDHDSNNVLLNLSDNSPIQSALQLEAKLKSLEDALQASNADAVNKLMERMEKLENNISKNIVDKTTGVANNTIDHESNNVLLCSSVNAPKQSLQQFKKEIKDLKDRIEKLENKNAVNETTDNGNPATPDNSTEKQQHQTNKHNSSQEPSNNGNNGSDDHSIAKEYQTTPKEKQEIKFDRDNLVTIYGIKYSDSSLETAIQNVIKFAEKMDLLLTRDQIKHIDVRIYNQRYLDYYVFFRTKTIKEAFLMKSDILTRFPHNLTIWNESEYSGVYIRNFKSYDLSYDRRIANVIGLAKQMGLTLMRNQIGEVDVFRVNQNCLVYRVWFSTAQVKDEFLKKSHILKKLPETKTLEIY